MKKILLFLMFALFCVPWAANAQETSFTVCNGGNTNSYVPIYSLYADYGTRSQFIFPADLLEDMVGGTIQNITFYNGTASINYNQEFTVYMLEVDYTTFASTALVDWNSMTEVFQGTLTVSDNEMSIELQNPYPYQGENLMIGIQVTTWGTTCPSASWQGENQTGRTGLYNNANGSHTWGTTVGGVNFLPKTTFTYTSGSGPTCEKPETLDVEDLNPRAASLTWTGGSGLYNVEVNGQIYASELEDMRITLENLTPATNYTVRVQSVCRDIIDPETGEPKVSGWKSVSFTTLCEAITTYPWTENFDSYTGTTSGSTNNLPQCYNYINGTTYSYYAGYPVIYNGSSNSGNNHLYLYSYYSSYYTYTDLYAILPEMEGLNGKQLTLYAKAYNASSSFTVGMMTDPTDASTFVAIDTKTPSTSIYEEFTFTLGEGNYVAFKMEPANSSSTYRGIRIDDIIIDNPPTCAKPTDLQHTGSTTTTATLSWTNGAEGQTAWQICLNGNENNLIMANSNPFTIEDLTASSVYTAKVRAYCSATDQSYWSNEISFATECDAISTLPWSENFDAYTGSTSTTIPTDYPNDQLPTCWQFLNRSETSGVYPQVFISSASNYPVSGNCLFFKSSSTTPLYAILPGFAEEIAGLQLTFTYRNEGTGTSNGQLIAGYMTNPADATTFVEVLTCDITTTLTEKEVLFADAPAGSYIAFKYQGGSANNYYLSIDNVSVDYAPSCPKPQSLAVTANSVTAHGAIVTWTEAGEATQWIVEFATDANFTDVLNETANDAPTYTFHGLDPETQYYVRVKAHCGAGNESQYSNVVNFTTDAACKVPTSLTVSNVTVNTATLSWTENGESTSWQICLNDDEDNLINATETTWTLENLTAETVYTAKVRGICNDEPTGWSSSVSFEPTAKLVIGSGTGTTGYLPSNTNYNFSYTQQIYTVAELGEAGVIESIDFYMTSTQDYERNLDIYMVSTDKESFANNTDWIAVTNADLVFSGNVNFTAQSWTTITLDDAFIYNGTQNVAIIVDDNTEEWSSRNFRSFTVESNQAHYCYQDNTNINPSAPSASNNSVTTSKNQIRILKSEMSDCMKPTQFTATEVGPDFVVLDWTENGTSESWYIFYQDTLNPGEVFVEVFEHPYTLTSLNNETTYSAFVVPSCGVEYDDPDNMLMSHTIEFTTLPGCPAPQNVEVSDITNSSVVVTWTGFNDSYKVRIENNSGFTETYENAESPLTIENLEGNTPYLMTVVGLCGETDVIEVEADPVLFVTPCTPYTITETAPYTQDFEAPVVTTTYSGVGEMPTCWDNYPVNVTASAKILAAGAQYNYAEEGQVLYFYGSGNNYAALPEFTNALNTLQISFKWATESSSNGTLTLGYITAQDEDYNTFTVIKTFAASSESYRALKEETVGLVNLPETATRLVFRWYYSSQWGCNVDDVEVSLAPACGKILVDAQNPEWNETFEDDAEAAGYVYDPSNPNLWTGVTPACWEYEMYTSASQNQIGEQLDTVPQVYRSFNTTAGGHYSLRMHYKSLLAMPELDENVDLGKIRLSMYVRQSFWRYQLQIGVLTADSTFYPVAVVNNPDKTKTYFECGFEAVKDLVGEGRRIAFKNFGSSENDPYAVNYLDDITLSYVNVADLECEIYPEYEETFESYEVGAEPNCWTVITEDVALDSQTKPQVYAGFNTTEGGSKSLRLKNRCLYAMPEFLDYPIQNFTMKFKLRQPNSLYRLQVGLVDEQGNFDILKTFKSGTTFAEKTVDFSNYSGNGTRVAFRNTLVPGTGMRTDYLDYSYNYIDDIYFDYVAEGKVEASDESAMDTDLDDIAVYPNPTTGNLYIDAVGIQKVECYNQMGQLVRVYDNVVNSIDLNNLSEGVYTLRITVPQGVTMRKVVKK